MTFRQPWNDVSAEIDDLERTTNTSLTSGCLRFVSLDRDYSDLSILTATDPSEHTPEAPSRGKPTNSFRDQTWICLNPLCAAVHTTRSDISAGVLVTVIRGRQTCLSTADR